jgi:hypothetical protein
MSDSDADVSGNQAVRQLYEARKFAAQAMLEAQTDAGRGPLVEQSYEGPLDTANAALKNLILLIGNYEEEPPSYSSPEPITTVQIPRIQERESPRRNSNTTDYSLASDVPRSVEIYSLDDAVASMNATIQYRTPAVQTSEVPIVHAETGEVVETRTRKSDPGPAEDTLSMKLLFDISTLETLFKRCDAVLRELGLGIEYGGEQVTEMDEDLMEELQEWRRENL